MARPAGAWSDKWFRDALRTALAQDDRRRLRNIAEKLVSRAEEGDVQAIKEIGDRLDGKPAQAVIGSDEDAPVRIETVFRWMREQTDAKS